MKEQTDFFGYLPRVTVFEYNKSSASRWWMNYHLPNGTRVRRPCSNKRKEAEKKALIKQNQLTGGHFDAFDRKKMGEPTPDYSRLSLDEAQAIYLEITQNRKSKKAMTNDKSLFKHAFGFFRNQGMEYLDQITPLSCVRLNADLQDKQRSEATIKNYWLAVSKVFNKLRKMRIISLENPMENVDLPKKSGFIRERMPSVDEIGSILAVLKDPDQLQSNYAPVRAIVLIALLTGARMGEILHAEWTDLDFELGVWHLRHKPECPGINGIGWSPKWGKERSIKLFPEALALLHSLPRLPTVGYVKDELGQQVAIPAEFILPKAQVRIVGSCPMKQKKGYYKCVKCREFPSRDECSFRQVVYSRCDSIKIAWDSVCKDAGVINLRLHDLRRFFNRSVLQERLGFTPEEAGKYIGNSTQVNKDHYSPISFELISKKMAKISFSEVVGNAELLPI